MTRDHHQREDHTMTTTKHAWKTRAACRDAPDKRIFDHPDDPEPALAYCHQCPVVAECLAWVRQETRRYPTRSARYSGIAAGRVIIDGIVQRHDKPVHSWSDEHVRECHLAWQCYGYRSGEAEIGEREYQRRVKANRKAARNAA